MGMKGSTRKVLIPFGVASSEVWGENTDIPLAESRRSEACKGSSRVNDFSPRKICKVKVRFDGKIRRAYRRVISYND
jgi:hypothetical protein